ncbi:diaminopimelate epimerase [Firmicutes bacterium CAG:194]|jgi:diaminopimelate epimerase|nr:diaminopimelate epimerase [Bacillota bacterium]MDY3769562.1 diaminopimelate epimerase [Lachnospiraceae bacterium]OLA30945.1 MAG: diaminopimelate epimerase [Firmicutes bacterium CAG_194_44_15]CCZ27733.1 diaminopimelate epimerase [Firmicutes bacterium CAG:194]MDD6694988.1 diaminopimelate epimerase [Bacillota bacterium]
MKFTKMHGCGNDYVYVNGFTEKVADKPKAVVALSDRHFGIGSDGVIFINPSQQADFEMEMYNADGTRAEMCGNGIRCVGKYVYDHGMTDKTSITVESFGKVKYLDLTVENGKVVKVKVNMGKPELTAKDVPVVSVHEQVIDEEIIVKEKSYRMTCVSMGNPHAVVFMDDVEHLAIEEIGPYFENHERFPNRTNTEFVQVIDDSHVKMRVWERGTGETLACGTGCCATAVACVLNRLTGAHVTVQVLGGEIEIYWDQKENLVYMTGPAVTVFEGETEEAYV